MGWHDLTWALSPVSPLRGAAVALTAALLVLAIGRLRLDPAANRR
jgi:hypothetical protein